MSVYVVTHLLLAAICNFIYSQIRVKNKILYVNITKSSAEILLYICFTCLNFAIINQGKYLKFKFQINCGYENRFIFQH